MTIKVGVYDNSINPYQVKDLIKIKEKVNASPLEATKPGALQSGSGQQITLDPKSPPYESGAHKKLQVYQDPNPGLSIYTFLRLLICRIEFYYLFITCKPCVIL